MYMTEDTHIDRHLSDQTRKAIKAARVKIKGNVFAITDALAAGGHQDLADTVWREVAESSGREERLIRSVARDW